MVTDTVCTELHSMRLFPKSGGAADYCISGIAARCDWVLLSDYHAPKTHLLRTRTTETPRHIFLSMRNGFAALVHFATHVLPQLRAPFVLVSGSEDLTLPKQCDARWRSYNAVERQAIADILNHPLLLHWFAENLDDDSDPRFSPLPTGMVFPKGTPRKIDPVCPLPLGDRPLQVLCGHRVRDGAQWDLRRQVTKQAQTTWAPFCTIPDADLPEAEFLTLMQSHAFVLCAEGGGLDPSPKAWQTILHGAIPIIRKTATYKAYNQLPVAFVETWNPASLTPRTLADWHRSRLPFYDSPELREQTLTRLTLGHWWHQISSRART